MYIIIIISLFSLIPLGLSFIGKNPFYKDFLFAIPAIIIPVVFFALIEFFFISWGIWGLNLDKTSGVQWIGIPLETYGLYASISFFNLFIYSLNIRILKREFFIHFHKIITTMLLLGFLAGIIIFRKDLITAMGALLCAFFLGYRSWVGKPKSMARFYMAFATAQLPIFLAYILLTATGTFWFSDTQIIGIKLGPLPIDIILYELALFLLNVGIFDLLVLWKAPNTQVEFPDEIDTLSPPSILD